MAQSSDELDASLHSIWMEEIVRAWADETWPLWAAVCWIAARGDVLKLNDDALKPSAKELLQALKDGRITAHGVRTAKDGSGYIEAVPTYQFRRAAPFGGPTPLKLILSDNEFLQWCGFEALDAGDGDRIACRHKTLWKRLTVGRRAVQERWSAPTNPGQKRGQGRPGELRERVKEDMLRDLNGGFALANAKQEELAAKYGCNKGTAEAARREVLSKNQA